MYDVKESDWKLLRKKLPGWQEAFMDKLNHEYLAILNSDDAPSQKFWALEDRIWKDKKHTGVAADMRRSRMVLNLLNLLDEGAITMEDLDEFSEELQEEIKTYRREK